MTDNDKPIDADEVLCLFGRSATDPDVEALFARLSTFNRPELSDDDEFNYHDWVLVRLKGVELGFSDSEYHAAAAFYRWGAGHLILTQAYFYAGFDDVRPYQGKLPHGLSFSDGRESVRLKLADAESTRRSYRTDTWDLKGYRLNVTYTDDDTGIDRIACLFLPSPIQSNLAVEPPTLSQMAQAFGDPLKHDSVRRLWPQGWDDESLSLADDDGDLDLTESYGVTVTYTGARGKRKLRSFALHTNRDSDSAGWRGELPAQLQLEDSPKRLFAKMKDPPAVQHDEELTGYAVWHLPEYTVHVLYSNLYNRLLRVTLIAPGR